ncbi:hypothetical protein DL98DRAFT_628101 [Cadophora sp. DSE1049]|nr:hypothetical protein DL98DRAFT_628101 [Cadophora sp. DSE1049]
MSSYGEDYSDEERNYIEHGGASQGESDVEGEGTGEGEGDGGNTIASGSGGGSAGGLFVSSAHESTTKHSKLNSGGSHSWDEGGAQARSQAGSSTGGTIDKKGGKELKQPRFIWNDSFPQVQPMGNLTAEEFCERLKLFRSPDATLIVGTEEVVFTVPKDLLCQNSKFFDRALNGKFKEGVEQTIRLPEDTVMAFQMMLQWIYTGNITISQDWDEDMSVITGIYLDFFKLADKIDLLGPLTPMFQKFRNHLQGPRSWRARSDCTQECILAANANLKGETCSCSSNWNRSANGVALPHSADCDMVYANCTSKQSHIDILRGDIITSKHIQTAFELSPDHEVRKILAQACVTSYILSGSMNFQFRFMKELETVDGFCQALLREVAGTIAKNSKILDPLNGSTEIAWPPGARDRSGWNY